MKKHLDFILLLLTVSLFASCVVIENQYTALAPGTWRGQFILEQTIPATEYEDDAVIQDIDETILPVMFEVKYDTDGSLVVEWMNGEERIISDSIVWGRNKKTGKDSIRIEFPVYDTHISALYEERVIEGYWEVHYKENYRIPFVAFFGQADRFKRSGLPPAQDLSGKWECTFDAGQPGSYPAIAELQQDGSRLTGTFLTETGDYRFLEGIVQEDEFKMSCFDGAHAFLFEGRISGKDSIQGEFWSGKHYKVYWNGVRKNNASLKDPFSINSFDNENRVIFKGLTVQGESVATDDPELIGKPKIIIVMGTWCPNCRDANKYLKEFINSRPGIQDSIHFQAIAFEAYRDKERNLSSVRRYIDKMDIPYSVWLGGYKDKNEASEIIPGIQEVTSYPTMIFVDRNDRIRYVHTGFAGPATSEFKNFDDKFRDLIDELRN